MDSYDYNSDQDARSQGYYDDAHSRDGYLGDNLLEETADQRPPVNFSRPQTAALPSLPSRPARADADSIRLVIAIDYGTTFTGVAFANTQSDIAQLTKIEVMQDWGPKMGNQYKVPSVYSYSLATNGEEQWGTDISENAVTMVNTKLELEVQDTRLDELELTLQVLKGTGNLAFEKVKKAGAYPAYTWKTPTEIVTDYLTKVCERVQKSIGLGYPVGANNLVDLVVTVPVKWSYQATNSTLRALRQAGFNEQTFPTLNDMILITEPEAASYYTARHLQEDGTKFLKLNENFILCDAGGGTVDVISYQVKQLEPHLELLQVSLATSDKCGAAYVDTNFKRWLRKIIGDKRYHELDPSNASQRIGTHATESGPMRQLIKEFEVRKKSFSNGTQTIKLDLPGSLHDLNIEGRVREGELTIQPDEMKAIFNPCVSKAITLIEGQRQQVERKNNRRVKNVFLVGGFGESPYLQEELQKSLKLRSITMRRPETKKSWTAVVQGAVIYGIEKTHHKKMRFMSVSTRSYGIVINEAFSAYKFNPRDCYTDSLTNMAMARKQFAWLVRKGDLILSDEKKVAEKEFSFAFRANDSRSFDLPVYVYPDEDDDVPDRWETGQHEVERIGLVGCDISPFSTDEFESRHNHDTGESCYIAYLVCSMQMSTTCLEVEVLVNATRVGHTKVVMGGERSAGDSADSPA